MNEKRQRTKKPMNKDTRKRPFTEMRLAEELKRLSNIPMYDVVAKDNQADILIGLLTDMIEEAVECGVEQGIEMHKDEFNHDMIYDR